MARTYYGDDPYKAVEQTAICTMSHEPEVIHAMTNAGTFMCETIATIHAGQVRTSARLAPWACVTCTDCLAAYVAKKLSEDR